MMKNQEDAFIEEQGNSDSLSSTIPHFQQSGTWIPASLIPPHVETVAHKGSVLPSQTAVRTLPSPDLKMFIKMPTGHVDPDNHIPLVCRERSF